MPVLKDVLCETCGLPGEAMLGMDVSGSTAHYCERCCRETIHSVVCNGGTKLKCFCFDFTGYNAEGAVECLPRVEATNADGSAYVERNGTPTHDKINAQLAEKVGARRDYIKSRDRRKRGSAPIFIDQGKP